MINKIAGKAFSVYPDQRNRAEYILSYKNAATDDNIPEIAEEGMAGYLDQLDEWDNRESGSQKSKSD